MVKLNGFEFGTPWRWDKRALGVVVPIILKPDTKVPTRDYALVEEVKDKVNFKDTGSIDKVDATNRSGKNVFIRGGSIISGGTQTRASQYGKIILPQEEKVEIPVRCVYASHPISAGAPMVLTMGHVPHTVYSSLRHGQSATWSAAQGFHMSMSRGSGMSSMLSGIPSDNLLQTQQAVGEFKGEITEILKKMKSYELQVGVVILDNAGVVGVELFDHPESWKALAGEVMKTYGDVLLKRDEAGLFEVNLERVTALLNDFVKGLVDAKQTTLFEGKGHKTASIDGDKVVGEATYLGERMIHMVLVRRGSDDEEPRRRIAPPIPTFPGIGGNGIRIGGEHDYWQPQHIPNVSWTTRATSMKSAPMMYFEHKGADEFLGTVAQSPSTWSDVEKTLTCSTKTLANVAKSAVELGFVKKTERANGRRVYEITDSGKKAFENRKRYLTSA